MKHARAASVLAALLMLSGCAFQWYYVGPDISARTVGPIVVNNTQMESACSKCRAWPGCAGCTRCAFSHAWCVIYLRLDASRNYRPGYCGLPEDDPKTAEEHEWCHAGGWDHRYVWFTRISVDTRHLPVRWPVR